MSTGSQPFIGVISDTHGLLRQETLVHVTGAELIIHAGDYGSLQVVDSLNRLGRMVLIRGNVDFDRRYPATEVFEHRGKTFYVIHNVDDMDISPAAARIDYVIFGHTHMPGHHEANGVQFINPGSCGPERRGTPVSMARIYPEDGWRVEFIDLDDHSYTNEK